MLQHLIDTEQIFSYRALAFARGETQPLTSFDEASYATSGQANTRSVESLVDELRSGHESLLKLVESFTPAMLQKAGMGFKGEWLRKRKTGSSYPTFVNKTTSLRYPWFLPLSMSVNID